MEGGRLRTVGRKGFILLWQNLNRPFCDGQHITFDSLPLSCLTLLTRARGRSVGRGGNDEVDTFPAAHHATGGRRRHFTRPNMGGSNDRTFEKAHYELLTSADD